MVEMNFDLYLIFALVCLFILTYQDLISGKVDGRINSFMTGTSVVYFSYMNGGIFYIVAIIVVVIVFRMSLKKFLGKGDINCITWMMIGFASLGNDILWLFIIYLFVFNSVIYLVMRYKKIKKTIYFPVLASAYIMVVLQYLFIVIHNV